MFCDKDTKTICIHGVHCIKWGCARIHSKGRIVGFDCPHDGKCWGNCEFHHSVQEKNSPAQKLRINQAGKKIGYEATKTCRNIYKSKCAYGDKCFFIHEPEPVKTEEPVKKKRRTVTCSMCLQKGHNKVSCWITKLPPPPEFML